VGSEPSILSQVLTKIHLLEQPAYSAAVPFQKRDKVIGLNIVVENAGNEPVGLSANFTISFTQKQLSELKVQEKYLAVILVV